VPEQSLAEIRKYMSTGPLTVEVSVSGETKLLAEGRLVFVDNAVDPSTGTIRLRGEFDNRQVTLWPGQFVNVSLRLFEQGDAIVVPSRALQTGPSGQYVYVIKPDMTADLRKVTVERSEGENSVVKGIAKDERVVTRGALRLAPGTRVEVRSTAETES